MYDLAELLYGLLMQANFRQRNLETTIGFFAGNLRRNYPRIEGLQKVCRDGDNLFGHYLKLFGRKIERIHEGILHQPFLGKMPSARMGQNKVTKVRHF